MTLTSSKVGIGDKKGPSDQPRPGVPTSGDLRCGGSVSYVRRTVFIESARRCSIKCGVSRAHCGELLPMPLVARNPRNICQTQACLTSQ